MNAKTPNGNGSDTRSSPSPSSSAHSSRFRRTLFTAGVFALLAMIYVPKSRHGYRLIFSTEDTSIAFFQLLLNVVFAALLGAILATIIPHRLVRHAWRWITGIALIALLIIGAFAGRTFMEAAANRARSDEEYAEELAQWGEQFPAFSQRAQTHFRNAAYNWRLALRFGEAARVEQEAFAKHAIRLRKQALLKVEPKVFAPTPTATAPP